MEALLYTVAEVMNLLKMSRSVLYQEIRSGRLESVKRGRSRLFTQAQLQHYVDSMEKGGNGYGEAA